MIIPLVLAGGSGTRLWPLSRELYPKQLLPLVGDRTMLQSTVARVSGHDFVADPVVVCTEKHRFLVAEQLRDLGARPTIIIEPIGRDTAPAVAAGALEAVAGGEDPVLLVLPADHVIRDHQAFLEAVRTGEKHARQGRLITFGIVPDRPETGYGYIKRAGRLDGDESGPAVYAVARFVEKPDLPTAEEYVAAGDLWNSGMFMFLASRYLEELEKFAPDMFARVRQAHAGRQEDLDFIRLDREAFAACPADSIDYAVMEKTAGAVVIPISCGWSDVGSWTALWEIGDRDENGNVLQGNVIAREVRNCFIHAEHRLVAAVGLEDHVVIETADAVMVASKSKAQDVKAIVGQLKADNRDEASLHRKVYRPWGSYECVDSAPRFQVKRIVVKPGARLSLQMHYHRAEHWIVVRGTARVTNGDREILLSENQSTYIPVGERHRLENPGTIPLELIEVQSGSYLGEDDIERFDDAYGREADG